jgi:hypothetical protein
MELAWAAHRSRTACAQVFAHKIARAEIKEEILAAQPRAGGRFTEFAPKQLLERPPAARAEKREEVFQSKFDKYVAETKDQMQAMAAQHALALGNINFQLKTKTKKVLSLRGKLKLAAYIAKRAPTGLQGGETTWTKRMMAAKLHTFLEKSYLLLPPKNKLYLSTFRGTPPFISPLPPLESLLGRLRKSAKNTPSGCSLSEEKWLRLLRSSGPWKSASA